MVSGGKTKTLPPVAKFPKKAALLSEPHNQKKTIKVEGNPKNRRGEALESVTSPPLVVQTTTMFEGNRHNSKSIDPR